MKKYLVSLFVVVMLICMTMGQVGAVDYTEGSDLIIDGLAGPEYTIDVPAQLSPKNPGVIVVEGYWPSNQRLVVSVEPTATLYNGDESIEVDITCNGINEIGSDNSHIYIEEAISMSDGGIVFGTWTGELVYTVDLITIETPDPINEEIEEEIEDTIVTHPSFELYDAVYQYEDDMTWLDWISSDYNTNNFTFAIEDDATYIVDSEGKYLCLYADEINTRQTIEDYIGLEEGQEYILTETYEN